MGFAAPWHMRASQTRDQTCVPRTGFGILHPWGTREALSVCFFLKNIYCMYLFGCAEPSLQHMESIFAAICHLLVAACGISFCNVGGNPAPCVESSEVLSHWTTREVPISAYFELCNHNSTSSFPQCFHHPQQSGQPPSAVPSWS